MVAQAGIIRAFRLDSIEPGNPFHSDLFHMGTELGSNVTVMYKNFPNEFCPYIIVIDKTTGQRIRVDFDVDADKQAASSQLFDSILHKHQG